MCLREDEEEKSVVDTGLEIVEGILSGLFDVGEDLVTGIVDIFQDPKATLEATVEAVTNPVETFNIIKSAISTSYELDMVNGDANSRAHWVTYALGTVATSIVGTKGVGALSKSGVAATKVAVPKVAAATNSASSSLANLLPYAPRPQFAIAGEVPYNTVNASGLKDQIISMARVESGVKGTTKPLQKHHYATNKSKKYTPQMENITKKYDLDLDDEWNKELLPHQGRHPNAYHDYVLDKLSTYDRLAKGDREKFLKMFEGLKQEVRDSPDMLYKEYWRSK